MLRVLLFTLAALVLSPAHAATETRPKAAPTTQAAKPASAEATAPAKPTQRSAAKATAKAKPTQRSAAKARPKAKPVASTSRRDGRTASSARTPRKRAGAAAPAAQTFVAQPEPPSSGGPGVQSAAAVVADLESGRLLYAKNSETRLPIASITKLMTAMVVLDGQLSPDELITIGEDDVDRLRHSRSRLPVGATFHRDELLRVMLIASDNRAAAALARHFPGGFHSFVRAMNRKAVTLGMTSTSFVDSSGLDGRNMSTAEDLARMVRAAYRYPAIRDITTTAHYTLQVPEVGPTEFRNTNVLVRQQSPEIGLSKTGYLREAGRCLVMQAEVAERPLLIVLLNGWGKYTPMGDFQRIRRWLQSGAQLSDTAPAEARPAEGAGPRV